MSHAVKRRDTLRHGQENGSQTSEPLFDGAIFKVGEDVYEFRFRPRGTPLPWESGEEIVEQRHMLPLLELKEQLDVVARRRGYGHVLNLTV